MHLEACIRWPSEHVGCFDPAMVLHRLNEAMGDVLEVEWSDLFDGHYEKILSSAAELGISSESHPVRCAARNVRELSPRYRFRLVTDHGEIQGVVDRYLIGVTFESEDSFPEPVRSRFLDFLRTLTLGPVIISESQERV